jgi:transcriptional regulator of arginine metabolism
MAAGRKQASCAESLACLSIFMRKRRNDFFKVNIKELTKVIMKRQERLRIIREIIKEKKISSQEDLLEELNKRGIIVTQATVSRDISSLNLVKVRDALQNEYYGLSFNYQGDPNTGFQKIRSKFKENVVSVEMANNIIVIKTNPGEAQGVAVAIDGSNFDEILGTVAGDDTIICIIKNEAEALRMMELFKSY